MYPAEVNRRSDGTDAASHLPSLQCLLGDVIQSIKLNDYNFEIVNRTINR